MVTGTKISNLPAAARNRQQPANSLQRVTRLCSVARFCQARTNQVADTWKVAAGRWRSTSGRRCNLPAFETMRRQPPHPSLGYRDGGKAHKDSASCVRGAGGQHQENAAKRGSVSEFGVHRVDTWASKWFPGKYRHVAQSPLSVSACKQPLE